MISAVSSELTEGIKCYAMGEQTVWNFRSIAEVGLFLGLPDEEKPDLNAKTFVFQNAPIFFKN